jgi:uncharacterized membrane protein YphA (DoxX/SURF4 family)
MNSIHQSTGLEMHTAPYALLLLRLALGAMWISHALLKVLVFTLPGAAVFFESAFLAVASLVHVLAGDGAYALKLPRMRLLTSAA